MTEEARADICPECDGAGFKRHKEFTRLYGDAYKYPCPTCQGTGKAKRLDREKIARLIYQYAELIDDRNIVASWKRLPKKERWLDGADQIIALYPKAPVLDREKIACLICGRRPRTNCMLVFNNMSCHWCVKAAEVADQIIKLGEK